LNSSVASNTSEVLDTSESSEILHPAKSGESHSSVISDLAKSSESADSVEISSSVKFDLSKSSEVPDSSDSSNIVETSDVPTKFESHDDQATSIVVSFTLMVSVVV
jgi:hypothetical protein